MRVLNIKNYLTLITSILLCGEAYAQSSNMQLPQQVGIYNPNIQKPQMRLPQQVGIYQQQPMINPNISQSFQQQKPVIDYNKPPVMNNALYNNVNGFKSPNRYTLQNSRMQTMSNAKQENEYGTEYFMSLGYGFGKYEGDGIVYGGSEYYPPMNEISEGLGDPKALYIGFGVMQDRNIRVEVNYTNLSGLKYDGTAYATDQWCGPWDFGDDFYFDCAEELPVSGGGISSNALMINVQIPLTEMFGTFFDGLITPYVGGGIGMAFNTLDDYSVYDEFGDANISRPNSNGELGYPYEGDDYLAGWYDYDGTITHFGATTNNRAWSVEAGLTFNIDRKTMFDVYYKMSNFGTVKSRDTIFYSYETVDILDPVEKSDGTLGCTPEAEEIDSEGKKFEYISATGWCEKYNGINEGYLSGFEEKGKIETTEIGVKLRLLF